MIKLLQLLEATKEHYVIDGPFGRETAAQFIERHQLEMDGPWVVLYHAHPKTTRLVGNVIRVGSYFAKSPDKAIYFASRDRDLSPRQIKCHRVLIAPNELEWGGHYQANIDIPLDRKASDPLPND